MKKIFLTMILFSIVILSKAQPIAPMGKMIQKKDMENMPKQKMERAYDERKGGPKQTVSNGIYYTIPGALFGGWTVDGRGYMYSMAMVPPFVDVTFANQMTDKTYSTWTVDGNDMSDHIDENGNLVCHYNPIKWNYTPILGHISNLNKYQYNENNYWVQTAAQETNANSRVMTYSPDLMMTPADNHGTRWSNNNPYRNVLSGYGFLSTAFLFGTGELDYDGDGKNDSAAYGFEQTFNPLLAPMYLDEIHLDCVTYNDYGPIPAGKSIKAYILALDEEGKAAGTIATFEATATDTLDFKETDTYNGSTGYYGTLIYKNTEKNTDNYGNLTSLPVAIPAGIPFRIQFEGMNDPGVNVGAYAIFKSDVEKTYIKNGYILFEDGHAYTFQNPLSVDVSLLGQYEVIKVVDKDFLSAESQEDFPADKFKGWNVLHVSADGKTINTEGLEENMNYNMGLAYVGTSNPWFDKEGHANYIISKEHVPDWIIGLEVDTTLYSGDNLTGYNLVYPKCKPLPDGEIGRYCELEIFGKAGISGNKKIYVIQGECYPDELYPNKNITFADANTKSLCVGKWDTNGDGELSESEAAAITSLGTTFKKSQISSFNELQYFTGLTSISDGAFSKSTVGAITLPENITSIGKEAFLDCRSLTSINIPEKVQTLGQNALSGCIAMTSITVEEDNTAFCDIDGVLFSKDKTTLIQFPAAKTTAYDVPEGTKTIGRDAFYMSKLQSLTLPATLEELVFDAFGYSKSLTELTIPEGVTTIGDYILDNCTALKSAMIPSTVTSIGEYICNGCNALTDVYCAMTSPLAITKNNFTTTAYSNAKLHVPSFAAETYKETEGWKYFMNIVGDMASNILLSDNITVCQGRNGKLTISLYNDNEIDGVQFDLTLPEGLAIATDSNGNFDLSTTDRSKKLTANCSKKGDGWYRFILFSIDRSLIEPGEGGILTVVVECPSDATPGNYEVSFTGISLSCYAGNVSINHNCKDFKTLVTINEVSTMPGDANGDFEVNISDVMMMVASILDQPDDNFIFANADMDNDGIVNITDVMNVVAIILGNPSPKAPANAKTIPYNLLHINPEDNGCTLHTTFQTQKVTAMQMSVILPDGCLLESATLMGEASRTHKVLTRRIDDNRYNIVVFSTNGTTLSTDAPVLDLAIRGRGGMVNVENIQCTDTDLETLLSADISTVITSIGGIIADDDNGNAPVYNTQGQRMNKPQRGINISEGRKVVVK